MEELRLRCNMYCPCRNCGDLAILLILHRLATKIGIQLKKEKKSTGQCNIQFYPCSATTPKRILEKPIVRYRHTKKWSRVFLTFSSLPYSDRFLESTNCVGMCTNLCKIPCQKFIQDSLGTAVYMSPSKFHLVLSMGQLPERITYNE